MRDKFREEFLKNIAIESSRRTDINLSVLVCKYCGYAIILPSEYRYSGCTCTESSTPSDYITVFSKKDISENIVESKINSIWD